MGNVAVGGGGCGGVQSEEIGNVDHIGERQEDFWSHVLSVELICRWRRLGECHFIGRVCVSACERVCVCSVPACQCSHVLLKLQLSYLRVRHAEDMQINILKGEDGIIRISFEILYLFCNCFL